MNLVKGTSSSKTRFDKYEEMGVPKCGVYLKPNGKLLLVEKDDHKWVVDEGIWKNHPIFRAKYHVIREMTGLYFINKMIHKCEYLGELSDENVQNRDDRGEENQPGVLRGCGDKGASNEEARLNGPVGS